MKMRTTFLVGGVALIAGCAEPPPPRSVQDYLDSPIVLEAALVRCSRDRAETRYDAECVNAREANRIVTAREVAEQRAELEAQSERKRQALRREQQAAAEARRRAEEAEKLREEAAYLAQFGQLPPVDTQGSEQADTGNLPTAVIPEPVEVPDDGSEAGYAEPLVAPASGASNAPLAEVEPEPAPSLEEIREELRRRNAE